MSGNYLTSEHILPVDFWRNLRPFATATPGGIKEIYSARNYPGIVAKPIRTRGYGDQRLIQHEEVQFSQELNAYTVAAKVLGAEYAPLSLFCISEMSGEERFVVLQEYVQGIQYKQSVESSQGSSGLLRARMKSLPAYSELRSNAQKIIDRLGQVEKWAYEPNGSITQTYLSCLDWIFTADGEIKLIDCGPMLSEEVHPGQSRIVSARGQLAAVFDLQEEIEDYLRVS